VDAQRTAALGAGGIGQALGAGHRRQHQTAVRAPGRSRVGLQPAQARAPEPRAAHVLGGQPALGAGRAGDLGQAAHQRARQGPAGLPARRVGAAASGARERRLRLRQRGHPHRAGKPKPALFAALAPDQERAAPGGAAVRTRRLEPCGQPGLPDGGGRVATGGLEPQAPRGHRAPAHPPRAGARARQRSRPTAPGVRRRGRAGARQALGVHGAGYGRGVPPGVHRGPVPGQGGLRYLPVIQPL